MFTARLFEHEDGYMVKPKTFPWLMFISMNLAIFIFFGVFLYLTIRKGETFGIFAVTAIYIMTVSLIWGISAWQYKKVKELGAWMDVDFKKQTVQLWAYNQEFNFDEIDHFKCIKEMRERGDDMSLVTELSLVTKSHQQFIIIISGGLDWKVQYRLSKDFPWQRK